MTPRVSHTTFTFVMTYELWGFAASSMIDWFEDQSEAMLSVQAYVEAGEANDVMLLVHDPSDDAESRLFTGGDLIAWWNAAQAELRRAS
jgi:hypothetical protein